jgi:hypothetical protein
LQIATYPATPARPATPPAVVLGEVVGDGEVVPVAAGLLVEVVALAAGLLVEVVPGVLAAVELLVVELLLLPHPATNAPQSSAATSNGDRLPIIGPP